MYLLTEWGLPEGKIFGSRSERTLCFLTELEPIIFPSGPISLSQ